MSHPSIGGRGSPFRAGGTSRAFRRSVSAAIAASILCAAVVAEARVSRFVVEQRRIFANGTSFDNVGQYERLDGTAFMEVSPTDPHNAVIVNLDKAPRNARGMVEFSAPFFILKPLDMARGNHKLFYGINNRGNKQTLGYFNYVPSGPGINDPITAADAGDGFMMRLGYTVVDAGWQGDVAPGGARLFPNFPVATNANGSPIVAPVRIEYSDRTIPTAGTFSLTLEGSTLDNVQFTSYETSDSDTTHSTLTVRDSVDGPKTPIAAGRWAFGACPTGQASLVASTTAICYFDGFRADRIYELVYPAKNPKVMGLAYAVTRDIAAFLRNQTQDDAGNANPIALSASNVGIAKAYSFGSSSTGMYQREYLYLGFNQDESNRKVFEALWIHKPGSHRLFANVEFADPNTYSRQDDRHDFLSTTVSPLTFAVTTDPVSGITDGLVKRPASDPLIFQSDTGNEFWEMKASLNVQDGRGNPLPQPPDNVRMYFLSSFQHSGNNPATVPAAAGMCANLTNPNYHGPTVRALMMALDAWADRGVAPPRSNYPRLENGTLVTLAQYQSAFPNIPGVGKPTVLNELEVLNYGPDFGPTGGRLSVLPPTRGAAYQLLVPRPDSDGLDAAGVRPMEIAVPLGTNTGWNVRAPGFRAPNLCGLNGSFIPFASTAAERASSGDPRPSLQERYGDHAGYVQQVITRANVLVKSRLLLQADADRFIGAAAASSVLGGGAVAADCSSLAKLTFEGNTSVVDASLVTSGTLVTPANQTLNNLPPFCRVQGVSRPSADSAIGFEVWLPLTGWNGKFLSSGEGGYAGAPNYTRLGLDGGLDELLRRGYATASTDTGHSAADTFWAVGHPERAVDYLYRSKHLVTVASKGLIAAFYGRAPTRSYFNSCSNGGRQGLMEIQRYPDDYDGVVVGAPWNFQSHSNAGFVWNAQALSAPGGAIPVAKLPAITAAVLAACDGNDGLVDGVIANPPACNFNPSVLLCQGAETNSCLTQPQLTALQKIYQGPRNPRTNAQIFPGFAIGGEATWTGLVTNLTASGLGNGYFANLVYENPNWDYLTFNFDSDMTFSDAKVGILGNSTQLDLSGAKNRGAKIIQYHGWNDQTLQPAYSPQYYDQVAAVMGGVAATQSFYRLFMVPGMTHCYFGPGATSFGGVGQQIPPVRDPLHDIQTALENWVENGVAPDRMIATKFTNDAATTRSVLLTRPLCVYPQVPRYNGSGDQNDAANFSCVAP